MYNADTMCGRFTNHLTWTEIVELYNLTDGVPARNLEPRYNIAPTTQVEMVRETGQQRELVPARWGLIPSWWKKPANKSPSTFNARSETVASKPMFRAAYKARRCLVPASGFYEWKRDGKDKQPYYITMADGSPMTFAGLWEKWSDIETGDDVLSCTVLTTEPNEAMASVHDRMPVILGANDFDEWLRGTAGHELLTACPSDWLQMWPVSKAVGNVRNQASDLIAAI